jgi:hypothetical protein
MARGHLDIEALGKASRKAALIGLLGIVVIISSLVSSSYGLNRLVWQCFRKDQVISGNAMVMEGVRARLERGDVLNAILELDGELSPDEDATARVYIHGVLPSLEGDWRGAEQIAKIEPIADLLRGRGFHVPRADILVTTEPDGSEVRYFRKDDEEEATDILDMLVSQGIRSCRLNYLDGHEDSELARPYYEVWLVGPPSPPTPPQLPPDLAAERIEFDIISQTESQRQVRITGVIKNVGRGAFESARGQQQAQLWEDPYPDPPPRPPERAERPSIAGLERWSEQTNFMSFAGSLRCMIFQEWGVWLSMAEARRGVAALLAPSPPAPGPTSGPASRLVASTNFERLAPDEKIAVVYERPWDAVSVAPGKRGTPPTYRLVIWYDPSIALDANPENDDTNPDNNTKKQRWTGVGIGSPRP